VLAGFAVPSFIYALYLTSDKGFYVTGGLLTRLTVLGLECSQLSYSILLRSLWHF
jgi:hypothetical protein